MEEADGSLSWASILLRARVVEQEVTRKDLIGISWPQVWEDSPVSVFDYSVWAFRFLSTHMGLYSSRMTLKKLWNCSESQLITYNRRLLGGDLLRDLRTSLNTQASSEQTCLSWLVGPFHPALLISRAPTHDLAKEGLNSVVHMLSGLWSELTLWRDARTIAICTS